MKRIPDNAGNAVPRITNPWTDRIQVTAVHKTAQTGTIKAFATVMIDGALEINGCKVIQQQGQRAWVAMPDRKRDEGAGYFSIVKCHDDQLKTAISDTVLAAWDGAQ